MSEERISIYEMAVASQRPVQYKRKRIPFDFWWADDLPWWKNVGVAYYRRDELETMYVWGFGSWRFRKDSTYEWEDD